MGQNPAENENLSWIMLDLRKINPSLVKIDGERAGIRHVRKDDAEEMRRLWEIENDPVVARFVEDLSENEDELVDFCELEKNYLVLAVEGKDGHVDPTEIGKLQGWITVYPEDKRRLKRVIKELGIDFWADSLRILEVGFARHPNARSGQMASALRQTLRILFAEHKRAGIGLAITAYADEANEPSRRVLEASGFGYRGRVKYRVSNRTHDYFYILSNYE